MFICMHIWVALTGLNELFEKKKKRHEPGESVKSVYKWNTRREIRVVYDHISLYMHEIIKHKQDTKRKAGNSYSSVLWSGSGQKDVGLYNSG